MGRKSEHLALFLEVLGPIPLLCFSLYSIAIASSGFWIKSVGSAVLISSIFIAVVCIISLFLLLIPLFTSKGDESNFYHRSFYISFIFTGFAVILVLVSSSYKKELEAHFIAKQYIESFGNAVNNTFDDEIGDTELKKEKYFHSRTLFIHDVVILLYALELLLLVVAKLFVNDIIAFFSNGEEEIDVESAPAVQNPLSIPKEENTDTETESVKEAPKEENNAPVIEEKEVSEKEISAEEPDEAIKEEIKEESTEATRENVKEEPKEEIKPVEKIEEVPKQDSEKIEKVEKVEVQKENNIKAATTKPKEINKARRNSRTRTQRPKKSPFNFDDLSVSDTNSSESSSFDLFGNRKESKINTTRKLESETSSSDSFFDIDLTARRPATRRRTRILKDSNEESKSNISSSSSSFDALLNQDFSKTTTRRGRNRGNESARRMKTTPLKNKTQKSRFGFDISESESERNSMDDLLDIV